LTTTPTRADVADEKRYAPFVISDSTGQVAIDAEKAKFDAEQTVRDAYGAPGYDPSRSSSIGGVLGGVLGNVLGMETTRGVRSSEWIVPAGQPTYVLGNVIESGGQAVVTKGDGPFIVSTRSEEELAGKYRLHYMLWMGFGAFFTAGGVVAAIVAATVLKK